MNNDLISRNSVIELLKKWSDGYTYIELPTEDAINQMSSLPTVRCETPNNDLISREDLKKAISGEFDLAIHNGDIMLMSKSGIVSRILAIIDNASTVEDRYSEGYSDGYLDGMSGADMKKGGAE